MLASSLRSNAEMQSVTFFLLIFDDLGEFESIF